MELASRFKRWVAAIIDNLISIVIMFIIAFFVAFIEMYSRNWVNIDNIENDPVYLIKSSVISMIVLMIYFAFFESSKHSATPGKMIFKIRVLTKDNHKLKFWQSCVRFWLLQVPFIPYTISGYFLIPYQLIITTILVLIWFGPVYFTKERKCVHDILSGTKVVKVAKK
ncbi:MAG: RDD family protein [Rickettsiales bacterium]|nr:RDD family protein [Rickettsiales bacterium]